MRIKTIERHLLELSGEEFIALRQMLQLFVSSPLATSDVVQEQHTTILQALQVKPIFQTSDGNNEDYQNLSIPDRLLRKTRNYRPKDVTQPGGEG